METQPHKQQIADLTHMLGQLGCNNVVICPGSRNAPLIQVFQRSPQFRCHSIVDERSAGYVALGMSRHSGKPVAVVTTSGTAALNLAPAVAEAFFQQVPLVVLTADRQEEYPPQFGNQRINQANIYTGNVKDSYNLPAGIDHQQADPEVTGRMAAVLLNAIQDNPGPVHLNIPLSEPLYDLVTGEISPLAAAFLTKSQQEEMQTVTGNGHRNEENPETTYRQEENPETGHRLDEGPGAPHQAGRAISGSVQTTLQRAGNAIDGMKKVLLVVGTGSYSREDQALLEALTRHRNVAVIAENLSNLSPDVFVTVPELTLATAGDIGQKTLTPDMVVTTGGAFVSKKTRLFVQGLRDVPVYVLEHRNLAVLNPHTLPLPGSRDMAGNYMQQWKALEKQAIDRSENFYRETPMANLTAIGTILDHLPAGTTVHLGNSGTVRYAQLKQTRADLSYWSNRGTSGIDGSLSTAVGAAMVSDTRHVIILGDLSFVYDSNALWNAGFPANLRVIVLNDHGGGIFRLLNGPDRMPFFEEFSVTHHPVTLKHLAAAFGLNHLYASEPAQIAQAISTIFAGNGRPTVIEIDTSGCENSLIFKQFFRFLQKQDYAKT